MPLPTYLAPEAAPAPPTRLRKRLTRAVPVAEPLAGDDSPARLAYRVGLHGVSPHGVGDEVQRPSVGTDGFLTEPVVVASFARSASLAGLYEIQATTLEIDEDSGPRRFILSELPVPTRVVIARLREVPGCIAFEGCVGRERPPEDGADGWTRTSAICPASGAVVYWLSPA